MKRPRRVGIRELRQNLSVYLRRVEKGEILQVTERGKPVALLTPTPENSTALGRLIAAGRATAPVGDLLDFLPPPKWTGRRTLSEALRQVREDRL